MGPTKRAPGPGRNRFGLGQNFHSELYQFIKPFINVFTLDDNMGAEEDEEGILKAKYFSVEILQVLLGEKEGTDFNKQGNSNEVQIGKESQK